MPVSISKEPAIYIPKRQSIFSYRNGKVFQTPLSDFASKAEDLKEIVSKVLSSLLTKASELSISVQPAGLQIEQDAEIESWKYAVIEIRLDIDKEIFEPVCDLLITEAYSKLDPEEATKVLLVFEHV